MIKELLRKDFDIKELSESQRNWLKIVSGIPEIKMFHGDTPSELDYELASEAKEFLMGSYRHCDITSC